MRNKSHFLFRGCFVKWVYNIISNRVLLFNKKIIININLKIGWTVLILIIDESTEKVQKMSVRLKSNFVDAKSLKDGNT